MLTTIKGRIIVILGIAALCGWALLPTEGPDGDTISPLSLGLDLQGGMHLAVEVYDPEGTMTAEARANATETTLTTLRNRIDEFGVREPIIQRQGDERIIVQLAGIDDPERAKGIVEQSAFLEFRVLVDAEPLRTSLPRIDRAIVAALGPEAVDRPDLAEGDEEADLGELLGAGDTALAEPEAGETEGEPPAGQPVQETETEEQAGEIGTEEQAGEAGEENELRPLGALLMESGQTGQFLVPEQDVPTARRYLELESVQDLLPRGVELKWDASTESIGGTSYRSLFVLSEDPLITGEYLADAGPASRDPMNNQPVVPFEMTRRGARIFERGTSRNVGERMAVILDDRVQSAPVIREPLSRRAQIEMGGGGFQEAQDLALILRAGALPAEIHIVEERTVGPSLGQDSIRQGAIAFALGILGIIGVMILYYRLAGALAVLALGVYVLLLLGGLAGLGATLTLPGIAGIILSLGMAVDANVLIFERIREELDVDKSPRTAVDGGFEHALSAIVDANITTLITAVILFQFGTGPVRGFAVTLSIGILASFFTALYVTRTLFLIYLDRHSARKPLSV